MSWSLSVDEEREAVHKHAGVTSAVKRRPTALCGRLQTLQWEMEDVGMSSSFFRLQMKLRHEEVNLSRIQSPYQRNVLPKNSCSWPGHRTGLAEWDDLGGRA